jgi:hypothetical protein
MADDKVREIRLRRQADRRGYRLTKSARRDPWAPDFGLYALLDVQTGGAVNPSIAQRWTHSWSLDQVEAWLNGSMTYAPLERAPRHRRRRAK